MRSRKLARLTVACVVAGAAIAIAAFAAIEWADRAFPPPLPAPDDRGAVVLAADGTPLRAFANREGVWRYPVGVDQVSPHYLEALITYEDRWFRRHPGVNPFSLLRAGGQWLANGRVVSGGSTLSMQVARILDPHPRTAGWREDRDAWELALLDAADAVGLPVLGVCRGMQVMAVHAGGALDQHTPDLVGHEQYSPGGDVFGEIDVATSPGSLVAHLVGERLSVNCHHHQSVAAHPGFTASAHAADGTLEAMEAPGDRFCLAVQWHPETAADVGLLAGLVRAASEFAASRDARADA